MELPEEITVIINKTDQGLWAKVKELPHCYTQAENYFDLISMLNDAIFSYAGIAEKDRTTCYIPKAWAEELHRKNWQDFLNQLRKKDSMKGITSEKYTATACTV